MTTAPSTQPRSVSLKRKGQEEEIGGGGLGHDTTDGDPEEPVRKRGKTGTNPDAVGIADTADIEDGPADAEPKSVTSLPTALVISPANSGTMLHLVPNAPNVFGANSWPRRPTATSAIHLDLAGRSAFTFAPKSTNGRIKCPSPRVADTSSSEEAARVLAAMSSERFSHTTDVACRSSFTSASDGHAAASMNPFPDAPNLFRVDDADEEEEEEAHSDTANDVYVWSMTAPCADSFETSTKAFDLPNGFYDRRSLDEEVALDVSGSTPTHHQAASRQNLLPSGGRIVDSGSVKPSRDPTTLVAPPVSQSKLRHPSVSSRVSTTAVINAPLSRRSSPVFLGFGEFFLGSASNLLLPVEAKSASDRLFRPWCQDDHADRFFDAVMETLRVRHIVKVAQKYDWPSDSHEKVRRYFKAAVLASSDNKLPTHLRKSSWRRAKLFSSDAEYACCIGNRLHDIKRLSPRFKQSYPETATQIKAASAGSQKILASTSFPAEEIDAGLLPGNAGMSLQWIMLACGYDDPSNEYQNVEKIELVATLLPQRTYLVFGIVRLIEFGDHLAGKLSDQSKSHALASPLWTAFTVCLALLAKRLSKCDPVAVRQIWSPGASSRYCGCLEAIRKLIPTEKAAPLLEVSKLLAAYR